MEVVKAELHLKRKLVGPRESNAHRAKRISSGRYSGARAKETLLKS